MTPARRSWVVLLLFFLSLIAFVVAWLLSINELFHNGNYPAWMAGGAGLLLAALIAERVPAA